MKIVAYFRYKKNCCAYIYPRKKYEKILEEEDGK
jgi:hypothetical protein